jgi:hypothetical protein
MPGGPCELPVNSRRKHGDRPDGIARGVRLWDASRSMAGLRLRESRRMSELTSPGNRASSWRTRTDAHQFPNSRTP